MTEGGTQLLDSANASIEELLTLIAPAGEAVLRLPVRAGKSLAPGSAD
jgi:hypothetical protein